MFIVIEMQTDKTTAVLATAYADRFEAESKYHTVLASASISSVPIHSATMLTEEGMVIKNESYRHGENAENENTIK